MITQSQRILDLALAGLTADEIAQALGISQTVVNTALQDLNNTPSGQAGGAATNAAITGNATITGSLAVTGTFGVNGATPVGPSAAYTKTYSTAARTIPAATAAAVATTASTSSSPFGYAQAQADAIPVAINALEADVLALKKLIVALVVDLEAVGIAG